MSAGTNLLVQILESFTEYDTPQKTMRRLYCESGQAGVKAYRYVNNITRDRLDEIVQQYEHYKYSKIKSSTTVLVFEELVDNNCLDLLKEMYIQIGGPSKNAYTLCNKKTQNAIQKIGL